AAGKLQRLGGAALPGFRGRGIGGRAGGSVTPRVRSPHAPVEAVELDLGKLLEHARDVHEGLLGGRAALGDAPKLDHRDLQVLRRGLGHLKARGDAPILRGGKTRVVLLASSAVAHLPGLDPLRSGIQRAGSEAERACGTMSTVRSRRANRNRPASMKHCRNPARLIVTTKARPAFAPSLRASAGASSGTE